MASLSTGSVNFPSIVYENPPSLVNELVAVAAEAVEKGGRRVATPKEARAILGRVAA